MKVHLNQNSTLHSSQGTMRYTITLPSEDVTVDAGLYLDADAGMMNLAYSSPHGGYRTVIRADQSTAYNIFTSAGQPTCQVYPASAVPSTLINLAPFVYSGESTERGVLADNFRFEASPTSTVGVSVDRATQRPLSVVNPSSYGDQTWSVYEFVNGTAPNVSWFEVPSECLGNGSQAAAASSSSPAASLLAGGLVLPPTMAADSGPAAWWHLPPATVLRDGVTLKTAAAVRFSRGESSLYRRKEGAGAPPSADSRAFATPARDQGACGGCWAFATMAATEINYNKKHAIDGTSGNGSAVGHLGVQHLLDCVATGESDATALIDSKGCFGGWPQTGMRHLMARGAFLETSYPYAAVNGATCVLEGGEEPDLFPVLQGAEYVGRGDVNAMESAVAEHGAVVAILSVNAALLYYAGGQRPEARNQRRMRAQDV